MKKIKKAIKKTAKNNRVTTRDVKKDISYAINSAIEKSKGSFEGEAFWSKLIKNKKQPTPEELIAAIVERVSTNNKLN